VIVWVRVVRRVRDGFSEVLIRPRSEIGTAAFGELSGRISGRSGWQRSPA
jgi:hypothetical protein